MKLDLSQDQPSVFGSTYWEKFRGVGIDSIPSLQNVPDASNLLDNSAYREFWLEIFRTDHPELLSAPTISRLNAFFAVESLDDAHVYASRSQFRGRASIYEIYSTRPGTKHDMTWLDHQFPRDFRKFGYYYLRYWKGLKIEEDSHLSGHEKRGSLMEVLLGSAITVGPVVGAVTVPVVAV
ncbi:MAG: hypothetical protein ACN6RG_08175 [Stenotrophomonas sp.]